MAQIFNRHLVFYTLLFGVTITTVLLAFGGAHRFGALLLIVGGILAIAGSKFLARGQNRINKATERFTWNPWGPATPRLFVIWGAGILILGFLWFISL